MGTPRVRRSNNVNTYENVARYYGNGELLSSYNASLNLYDHAYCEDELNEMSLIGKTDYDIGGMLTAYKIRHDFQSVADHALVDAFGGVRWTSEGPIIAYPTAAHNYNLAGDTWFGWVDNTNIDPILTRIALGATAISRCRPAKPQASLSTTVIEALREGIPSTLKQFANMKEEVARFRDLSRSNKGRQLPSKYLEYQFGWKPLVSDIRKAARALIQYQDILEDLRRNSGKRMRRRYTFPAVSEESEYLRDWTTPWPNLNAYIVQQAGQRVITQRKTKNTWFTGEFVYTYPSVDAAIPSQMIHGARQLLGLDLTPETIWNVAPWTWLSDWVANVGDVVANFTAIGADGLVLRYGYLMQEAEARWDHVHHGVTIQGTSVQSAAVRGSLIVSAKTRIAATPYGFGVTWDSFDPRQLAILASIGITRRGQH